jgi:radical SAM superfamily enzyme YgiQ (UPF0313 family)
VAVVEVLDALQARAQETMAQLTEEDLDQLPFPDYSDFPWQSYPNRIIPMISGRGCGWGVCKFCSDVTSTAGRSYRSRSPGNVREEIRYQADRYQASI